MKHKTIKAALLTVVALILGLVAISLVANFMIWWIDLAASNPDAAGLVGLGVILIVATALAYSWIYNGLSRWEDIQDE